MRLVFDRHYWRACSVAVVVDVVAFSGNFFLWWIDVNLWWMWWHFQETFWFYPPQSTTSCINRFDPPQLSETIDLLELAYRNGSWFWPSVVDCGACFRETPLRTPYKGVFRNVVPHPPQSGKFTAKWEIHHGSKLARSAVLRWIVASLVSTALGSRCRGAGANPRSGLRETVQISGGRALFVTLRNGYKTAVFGPMEVEYATSTPQTL
jgi:hypothetical protein